MLTVEKTGLNLRSREERNSKSPLERYGELRNRLLDLKKGHLQQCKILSQYCRKLKKKNPISIDDSFDNYGFKYRP